MTALSLIQATVEPVGVLSADEVRRQVHAGLHNLGFRQSLTSRDGFIFKDHDANQSLCFVTGEISGRTFIEAYFGRAVLLLEHAPTVTHKYIQRLLAKTKTLVHNLVRDAHACPTPREFNRKLEHELTAFSCGIPDLDHDSGDYFYQMEHPHTAVATVEPGSKDVTPIVRSMLPGFEHEETIHGSVLHKDGFEVDVLDLKPKGQALRIQYQVWKLAYDNNLTSTGVRAAITKLLGFIDATKTLARNTQNPYVFKPRMEALIREHYCKEYMLNQAFTDETHKLYRGGHA